MALITTGFNTAAQATAILAKFRTELAGLGVDIVTRGRLWRLPDRPCVVLVGPSIDIEALGIGVEEGVWHWLILIARDIGDNERRADLLDTWGDTAMAALLDLTRETAAFVVEGGDGPRRVEDARLLQLIDRLGEEIDPIMIEMTTRGEINPPSC